MSTALEQSFADICARHDLIILEPSYRADHKALGVSAWSVGVHWVGYTNSGHNCTSAYGDSLQEAMTKCLDKAADERKPHGFYPQLDCDEPLPEVV